MMASHIADCDLFFILTCILTLGSLREFVSSKKEPADSCRPASSGCSLRADNEPSWRGPDKIEWETGHQGQDIATRVIQHLGIFGPNHFYRVHAIMVGALESHQRDFVVLADIAQGPEK